MQIKIPKTEAILNDRRNSKLYDLISDLASLKYFEAPNNPNTFIYIEDFVRKFEILLTSDSPTFFDELFIADLTSTYDLNHNMDNIISCSVLLLQKTYEINNDFTLEPTKELKLITTIDFRIFIEKENERPFAEASAYLITQAIWNAFSQKNGRKGY